MFLVYAFLFLSKQNKNKKDLLNLGQTVPLDQDELMWDLLVLLVYISTC